MNRGMSHVEVVLSFVLFIAAVSFSLLFLIEMRHQTDDEQQFVQLTQETRAQLTIPITITSVIITPGAHTIIRIANISDDVLLLNESYDVLPSNQIGSDALVLIDSGERIVYAVQGAGIRRTYDPALLAGDPNYTLGSNTQINVLNGSMMRQLALETYEQGLQRLPLPAGTFVNVSLSYENQRYAFASLAPSDASSVSTTNARVQVITPEGALKYGLLSISLW